VVAASFEHDTFLIEQLIRPVVNLYQVRVAGPGGEPQGQPIVHVRQKRLALREDIRFFADEEEQEELFRVKARTMLDLHGRHDVTQPDGTRIGIIEKVSARSRLRSTWRVRDSDEAEVAVVQERSQAVAIIRRLVDFVPWVGEFIPIPYHFTFAGDGGELGELRRKLSVRDRYVLDLSADAERRLDRRVAIALAVTLDALQGR